MKHRAWVVATFVLGLAAGLLLWHLLGWTPGIPSQLLTPPAISRAAAADTPPITNPFGTAASLPKELTDQAFSEMITEFSEPGGYFMYENLLSNERSYQDPIPSLIKVAKPGGVYL